MSAEPEDPKVPTGLDLPEPYKIPADLLERWNDIPSDRRVGLALPRASWDALYSAIDQLNFAVVTVSRFAVLLHTDPEAAGIALTEFGSHAVNSQSSLRHFQAMLMDVAVKETQDG
jgi:hypothetical protein